MKDNRMKSYFLDDKCSIFITQNFVCINHWFNGKHKSYYGYLDKLHQIDMNNLNGLRYAVNIAVDKARFKSKFYLSEYEKRIYMFVDDVESGFDNTELCA